MNEVKDAINQLRWSEKYTKSVRILFISSLFSRSFRLSLCFFFSVLIYHALMFQFTWTTAEKNKSTHWNNWAHDVHLVCKVSGALVHMNEEKNRQPLKWDSVTCTAKVIRSNGRVRVIEQTKCEKNTTNILRIAHMLIAIFIAIVRSNWNKTEIVFVDQHNKHWIENANNTPSTLGDG